MINRRSLLRRGAQSAVSLGMSSVVPFSLLGSAGARASDDYRAVVCATCGWRGQLQYFSAAI